MLVSPRSIPEKTDKENTRSEMIKQRLTQNIDNGNPYLGIKPIIPGQQPNSVLFEPMVHIRLSRSTYKVTSFIEFAPYIQSFINFEKYLSQFVKDIQDPARVSGFVNLLTQHRSTILSNSQARELVSSYKTIHVEKGEIIQQRFASMIRSEGVGTGMLVLDNMTWYVELRANLKL